MTELTVEPTDRNTLEDTDDEQRPATGIRVHQLQQIGASLKRTRVTYNLQGNIHDVSDTLRLGYTGIYVWRMKAIHVSSYLFKKWFINIIYLFKLLCMLSSYTIILLHTHLTNHYQIHGMKKILRLSIG